MGFLNIIATLCDPLGIIRKYVIHPLIDTITKVVYNNQLTEETKDKIRDVGIRICIILFAVIVLIWSAIFMYIAFYYTYMPAIEHNRPVHMQYEPCPNAIGPCSFPYAHVSLTKRQQLLMVGQSYRVLIHIEMPESIQNHQLGMFMVCAEMRDQDTQLQSHSCRSAMLSYQSPMIHTLKTILYSPLFLFGIRTEKQIVPIEMFSNFEDDQAHPVTDVYIEIQSKIIQFYSVTLSITAHFTGLRYVMFHWPILSASIGISVNLFFIMILFILSWYHWADNGNGNRPAFDDIHEWAANNVLSVGPTVPRGTVKMKLKKMIPFSDGTLDGFLKTKTKKNVLNIECASPDMDIPHIPILDNGGDGDDDYDDDDISILGNVSKSDDDEIDSIQNRE